MDSGKATRSDRYGFRAAGPDDPAIPIALIELKDRSKRLYRFWWTAHYTFGITGVVAGTLLAVLTTSEAGTATIDAGSFLGFLSKYSLLIGIAATVSTSMVTFLGPLHKAERYWSAFHHLEQAFLEFRGQDLDPRTRKLMKRAMQARKILQVVDSDEKMPFEGEAEESEAKPA